VVEIEANTEIPGLRSGMMAWWFDGGLLWYDAGVVRLVSRNEGSGIAHRANLWS
jgi:hypothetical protein